MKHKNVYKLGGIGLIVASVITLVFFGFFRQPAAPKLEFNAIVSNQDFVKTLSTLHIKMIAPASGTAIERIEKLKELNLIDVPENIIDDRMLYHAKTDEDRLKYFKDALTTASNDPAKKTILWALRGGYGSARLINDLKKMPKPQTPVMFIGYSDMTALHLFLAQNWQWKSIHGAMLNELLSPNKDPKNFEKIADLLSGKTKIAKLDALRPMNKPAESNHKITGLLTGGNLTMLETSLGTNWQIKADNKIVFIEDLDEDGYKIDRGLNHLKQAGIFKNAKAIILGEFSCPKEGKIEEVEFALQRFANETPVPVYKTNEFGHGNINYPLIYNASSEINKIGEHAELLMHMY